VKVDVTALKSEVGRRERFDLRQEFKSIDLPGGQVRFRGPARLEVTLTNTGGGIWAQGSLHADLDLECSRCLRRFAFPVKLPFDEEFREGAGPGRRAAAAGVAAAADAPGADEDAPLTQREDDVILYRDDAIDLAAPAIEALILAVPMKPVCDSACRGLCPRCGQDLNEGECDCETETSDPRLAALSELARRLRQ